MYYFLYVWFGQDSGIFPMKIDEHNKCLLIVTTFTETEQGKKILKDQEYKFKGPNLKLNAYFSLEINHGEYF